MIYRTHNDFEEEIHPWPPYVPKGADKVILGTFPTKISNRGSYEFFYPNPNNEFWPILFKIAGVPYLNQTEDEPVAVRKLVLDKLNLGIADMAKKVLRQNKSSRDNNLFPIEFTDILSLLDQFPTLRCIIVTSSSGGNSVMSWLYNYCRLNDIKFEIPKGRLPNETSFNYKGRIIKISSISSTSRLAPVKGEPLLKMYKDAITKRYDLVS